MLELRVEYKLRLKGKMSEKDMKKIYLKYKPMIRYWLVGKNISMEEIDESIDDIFMIFFKKYDGNKYAITDFFFLTTQSILSKYKKDKIETIRIPFDYDVIDDFEENLEYEKMWASRISDLHNEIKQLPYREKDIAISFFINREKIKDIAHFQNININTVKSRLKKSKLRLRDKDIYCNVNFGVDVNIVEESKKTLKTKSFVFKPINAKKIKQRYKNLEKPNRSIKSKFFLKINNHKGLLSTKHLYENYGDNEFMFTIYMGDTIKKYGHTFNLNFIDRKLQLLIDNEIQYYWNSGSLVHKSGLHRDSVYHSLENNKVRVRFRYDSKKDRGTLIEILK